MEQTKPALIKPCLSGTAVKYTGIVMMVFDHIHQIFTDQGTPSWFHWIGRPVMPIFLFMCAQAFWHTWSRVKYLLRLFICFELMNIGNMVLNVFFPVQDFELTNNVFQTLLLSAFYMFLIEMIRAGIHEKRPLKITGAVLLMLLPIAGLLLVYYLLRVFPKLGFFYPFVPNFLFTEGSFSAVVMAVLFYLFRKSRSIQVLIIVIFSVLAIIITLFSGKNLLSGSPQWLLIFALIPILLYNGERGKGNKYFFYIFYPAHIYLFYIVAWFMATH
jgi:hypothetical protein